MFSERLLPLQTSLLDASDQPDLVAQMQPGHTHYGPIIRAVSRAAP